MKKVTTREKLRKLQKTAFQQVSLYVRDRQKHDTPLLKAYRKRYEKEVRSFQKFSTKTELLDFLGEASIVYCGDFHTLRQAQRTAAKLIKALLRKRGSIHLALELLSQPFEKLANDYVRRRIGEELFLTQFDYHNRWGFPWKNYRQLFDLARENNLRIVALSAGDGDQLSLKARDQKAAEIIVEHTKNFPDTLLFCLYGDLHVASPHIPFEVKKLLSREKIRRKQIQVFQNSESIYWQLFDKNFEEKIDVVRLSSHSFCVLHTSPWIKWQSYHSWLEDQSSLLEIPDRDEEVEIGSPDYYHQVLDLADRISAFLDFHPQGLDLFEVFTAGSTQVIQELDQYCAFCRRRDLPITSILQTEIHENGSCFFPESSILYLSNLSQNRAAEKASQIVVSKLNPSFSIFRGVKTSQELFYRLLLWEAIGFLGSKIINPKRKCNEYLDFKKSLRMLNSQKLWGRKIQQKKMIEFVLQHRAFEKKCIQRKKDFKFPKHFFSLSPRVFYLSAQALGYILANRLYERMTLDRISMTSIRTLFDWSPLQENASEKYLKFAVQIYSQTTDIVSKEDLF